MVWGFVLFLFLSLLLLFFSAVCIVQQTAQDLIYLKWNICKIKMILVEITAANKETGRCSQQQIAVQTMSRLCCLGDDVAADGKEHNRRDKQGRGDGK